MDKWHSMLSVKLDYNNMPGYRPDRYMSYRGSKIDLTEAKFNEILEKIPEKYYNQKEKLTRFVAENNDEGLLKYFCEFEVEVFDFRTREYTKKKREVILSDDEYNELYLTFKEIYNFLSISMVDNFYDQILKSVSNIPVSTSRFIRIRNELLTESDKYMISDFPISDDEREMWIKYRQELRDLTNQEAWPNDIENIEFPISPRPLNQALQMFTESQMAQMLGNDLNLEILKGRVQTTIKKYFSFLVKSEVVKSLDMLRIPLFVEQDMTAKEIVQIEDEINGILREAQYSMLLDSYSDVDSDSEENTSQETESIDFGPINALEEKIDSINSKLREYNVNFTIGDLISNIMEDIKLQNEAELILNSIEEDLNEEEI